MRSDKHMMEKYIDDIIVECKNFMDVADFAKVSDSEHMLKLSIIGHNLKSKFDVFEHERIRERFKDGRD